MHYIQNKILHKLTLSTQARYAELRPQGIESNHFIYHLKQLINDKLVLKTPDGSYQLSSKGQAYADKVSLENFHPRSQPKIVNLIACSDNQDQYLLYKRKHQPFIGLSGFPYGKIHLGETIKQSSERELAEKTNLRVKLMHRGDVYITVYDGPQLLTHTLFHVHSGQNPRGQLKAESPIGYCYWSKVKESAPKDYFPGFMDIYKLLKPNPIGRFFAEYEYKL